MQIMLDKIKKLDKRLLLIIPVIVVIILIIIGIISLSNKLTSIEKIYINNVSDSVIPYINEVIDHSTEDGNYVSFAVDYLYNVKGKDSFTADEILDVINNSFNVNYTRDDAARIGLTSYLMNKGVNYDSTSGQYTYKYSRTRADLAETPIVTYKIKKIKKSSDTKFVVTYDKYVVTNPYTLLNYYIDKDSDDSEAVKEISQYLKGDTTAKTITKYIDKDNIDKVGKKEKDLKIEFIVKDNKLLVDKIK